MKDSPDKSASLRDQALAIAGTPGSTAPDKFCSFHPERQAALLCSCCAAAICVECLAEISEPLAISCAKCREEERKRNSATAFFRILRLPAIWVLLCLFASALAYAAGLGNPSLDELIRTDKGKEWNLRKAPQLLVRQAARERRHAIDMAKRQEKEQAKRWAARAATSFQRSAAFWADAPISADLKIAEAEMQELAGESVAALRTLESIKIPNDYPSDAVLQYRMGLLLQEAGNEKEASARFEKALAATRTSHEKTFEQMIDLLSAERRKADLQGKIRVVCGTAESLDKIATDCRVKLGKPEDKDEFSKSVKRDEGRRPIEAPEFKVEFLSPDKE
ncbi:MAG: hypothetical protein A2X49_17140 [Lentisphaerae bacterium GWF2_52_8]|nr:MAG: hypothetical protein A2X49_17140 [Lentisphaerae bacterium GWF2_52_8]